MFWLSIWSILQMWHGCYLHCEYYFGCLLLSFFFCCYPIWHALIILVNSSLCVFAPIRTNSFANRSSTFLKCTPKACLFTINNAFNANFIRLLQKKHMTPTITFHASWMKLLIVLEWSCVSSPFLIHLLLSLLLLALSEFHMCAKSIKHIVMILSN